MWGQINYIQIHLIEIYKFLTVYMHSLSLYPFLCEQSFFGRYIFHVVHVKVILPQACTSELCV